jgi:predicted metalloprotease with PDZ domain
MWDEHAFKRVYWTGAAYFLRVDTRLRTETGGRLSVDHALAGFQRCCLRAPSRERWSAEALIEALGRFGRADIWRQEYERMIDAPARPDIGRAFERLGVRLEPDGRIGFDDREPAERLREAIALGDRQIKGSGSSPRPLDDYM